MARSNDKPGSFFADCHRNLKKKATILMKKCQLLLISLVVSLASSMAWAATTYKWLDDNGNVVYSQTPPAEGAYEVIHIKQSGTSSSYPSAAESPESSTPKFTSNRNEEEKQNQDIQQQEAKAEEIRKKNCEAARKNLEAYTVFRRFKQPDGSYVRLDDDERLKRQQKAKDDIKEFCD